MLALTVRGVECCESAWEVMVPWRISCSPGGGIERPTSQQPQANKRPVLATGWQRPDCQFIVLNWTSVQVHGGKRVENAISSS